jgi:hypothetical protein
MRNSGSDTSAPLGDFHRAGAYPERRAVAVLGRAVLLATVGIVAVRRRRLRG